MHHHKHNNNSHRRSDYPTHSAPGGANYEEKRNPKDYPSGPVPQREPMQRRGIVDRLKTAFREKDATPEEIEQLKLRAQRQSLKSGIKIAKHEERAAKLQNSLLKAKTDQVRNSGRGRSSVAFGGGGLLDSGSFGTGFGSGHSTFGRGLDSLVGSGGQERTSKRSSKQTKPAFGNGLSKMFGAY